MIDFDFDEYEKLVYSQVCDELEWTAEYWTGRFMLPIFYCVCHALVYDVVCRLSGNLDADL